MASRSGSQRRSSPRSQGGSRPRPLLEFRRRSRGLLALAAVASLIAPLAACAPPRVVGWRPPPAPEVPGVSLVAPGDGDGSAPQPAPVDSAAQLAPDPLQLGLVGGRLRNDELAFAARFVYIPGAPAFNDRVDELLWQAISATGGSYAPQAQAVGAGLGDRGCVAGSGSWSAADVLSRPETGPVGVGDGVAGTAITCEVTAAFGEMIAVTLRTVTGAPDAVTSDVSHRLVADLAHGTVEELGSRWSDGAPAELWDRAVVLLRRQAGALSEAPLAAPGEDQLQLAARALDSARPLADGGVEVAMPAGLASPELEGLGIIAAEEFSLRVDAETAQGWASAQQRELLEASSRPFVGIAAAATSVPVDCSLIPCVALTYDDGPSGLTPQLLDTLQRERASATFFMIGGHASANPETVQRAASEGHEIGSHTMTHADLTRLSAADARAEVLDAAAILRRLSGQPVAFYRPPYGAVNAAVLEAVGLPAILWSIDTRDWQDPGADALFERAVVQARPGSIVLFHDTHTGTVEAADDVIEGLRDRGFEPVTVTELFGGAVPSGRVSAR